MEEIQYEVKDSRDLQLFSLMQAMGALGYQLMRTNRQGYVFYNPIHAKYGKSLMSVQNAMRLHNTLDHYTNMGYDAYTINQFLSAKVVHNVKLQYCKKKKLIKVNGGVNANYVAFTDEAYPSLFSICN